MAGRNTHEFFILRLHSLRPGLPVAAFHILDQSLKGHVIDAFSPLSAVTDLYFSASSSMDQDILDLLGIFLKRSLQGEPYSWLSASRIAISKALLIRTGLPA